MTLIDMFEDSVSRFGRYDMLLEKGRTKYESISYSEVMSRVRRFAMGLVSLELREGDRMAILSEGRTDWLVAELAALYVRSVSVPLSTKLETCSDLKMRLSHSGSSIAVVSAIQLPKVRKIRSELPDLRWVVVLDEIDDWQDGEISKTLVYAKGDEALMIGSFLIEDRRSRVVDSDLATIIYTSGTTSKPKGVMLTHRNYTANVEQAASLTKIGKGQVNLAVLPWDHAFAHTACIYIFIYFGAVIASVQIGHTPMDYLRSIPFNIREVRPDVLMVVPALAKSFKKSIETAVRSYGGVVYWLFKLSLGVVYLYNGIGYDRGSGLRALLRPFQLLMDKFVYSKIRCEFGGRLRYMISGGAIMDIGLQRFFYALGMPMMHGYGLTEASPFVSCNIYERKKHKLGSCGRVAEGVELTIRDEDGNWLPVGVQGEVVIRGENVMRGYWKNTRDTELMLVDGWLHTGDVGFLDEDGFLFVLGRFKSMLVGGDGEKYSPEGIEEMFIQKSPYIDQCMLHNSQNPYTMMLLVPDVRRIRRLLAYKFHNDLTNEYYIKEAIQLVYDSVQRVKRDLVGAGFPSRWLPSVVVITGEPFSKCGQCVNSTMKLVRNKIEEYYYREIEFAYNAKAKDIYNVMNFQNMRQMLGGD